MMLSKKEFSHVELGCILVIPGVRGEKWMSDAGHVARAQNHSCWFKFLSIFAKIFGQNATQRLWAKKTCWAKILAFP